MSGGPYRPAGRHLLADFHGVAPACLSNADELDRLLRAGAQAAGATVLFSHFHRFGTGRGVTGVVLLAESHITIHTWPEDAFAAADIFMCGDARPQRALDVIRDALAPADVNIETIERGRNCMAGEDGQ